MHQHREEVASDGHVDFMVLTMTRHASETTRNTARDKENMEDTKNSSHMLDSHRQISISTRALLDSRRRSQALHSGRAHVTVTYAYAYT